MCAELAHQHAVEDLHTVTEHSSEQEPTESMSRFLSILKVAGSNLSNYATFKRKDAISRRSSGQGAQFDEPRKPED